MRIRLVCLCMAICFLSAHQPASAAGVAHKRTASEALAEVNAIGYSGYSPAEYTGRYIALLRREMKDPSASVFGWGGGPINSGYVQEVIMGSVFTFGQDQVRDEIRRLVASKLRWIASVDRPMADRLLIILGNTGDRSTVPALMGIVKNHPDGFMRHAAVLALGGMRARASIPVLTLVLWTDTYARVRTSSSCIGPYLTPREMVYSPVRRAADDALRSMGETVSHDAQFVDPKCAVPGLEQALASETGIPYHLLEVIALLASPEGEAALQRYVDAKKKDPSGAGAAEFAGWMIERSKLARARAEAAQK